MTLLRKLEELFGTDERVVGYQCLGCGVTFAARPSGDVTCPDCGSVRLRRTSHGDGSGEATDGGT